MTAAAVVPRAVARDVVRAWAQPVLLIVGLAAVVGVRWAGTRLGLDALAFGAVFGACLLALAWIKPARLQASSIVIGVAAGLALVGLTIVGAALSGANLPSGLGRPAAPFLPWAVITILVAAGEEAFLRGRLFDASRRAGGVLAAVAITSVAFALLHVPLYGWHVVPLDLGVGLGFAGLRLLTRGIAAPAAAHAVADLATWWL